MSADAFSLLGLPPRAALDEETLQAAYLQATRLVHPDQTGGDTLQSAELNAAKEILKSPVTRLKHLIENHSDTPWRAVPLDAALMGLFEKLGPLLQASASFLKKKQSASTALAKALLANEEMRLRESLEDLGLRIEELWQQIEAQLDVYDSRIAESDASVWPELQGIQARLAYLSKWRSQIREVLLGLML
ncbi:J domain-containing protein [Prosthecobacter sp. SYSU 5D2]|uniref:J domain-containing protein n=1 Tax=Prosthecobacter sp. SYSU 5D2 TaxID=3134134 RepID=UPI0031FF0953